MRFQNKIKDLHNVTIPRHLILNLLAEYKSPNDKISELLKSGDLIALKKGYYLLGNIEKQPEPYLIANQLYGPSYVSLESALSYWSMIPERVYEICSVTMKTSKIFSNKIGRFSYSQLPFPYYSFDIKNIEIAKNQMVLIASVEKALCDKIILTSGVFFRSLKQVHNFLIDDLRIEFDEIKKLDYNKIKTWMEDIPKKSSIQLLIKYLEKNDKRMD